MVTCTPGLDEVYDEGEDDELLQLSVEVDRARRRAVGAESRRNRPGGPLTLAAAGVSSSLTCAALGDDEGAGGVIARWLQFSADEVSENAKKPLPGLKSEETSLPSCRYNRATMSHRPGPAALLSTCHSQPYHDVHGSMTMLRVEGDEEDSESMA